jgi:hypothetical protein
MGHNKALVGVRHLPSLLSSYNVAATTATLHLAIFALTSPHMKRRVL